MHTLTSIGTSCSYDAAEAACEAAQTALAGLGRPTADVAIVFATTGYDQHALLRGIREMLPGARVCGCSGEGIIAGDASYERDHAVVVMALHSTVMRLEPTLIHHYSDAPKRRAAELTAELRAMDDLRAVLVFPDGLTGNCTEFLRALQDGLGPEVPIAGGTSGDAMQFQRTYQYLDDVVASDAISVIAIRGHARMEVSVNHGCAPVGLLRTLTRVDGGWLYEIDGKPAWDVFKEYLDGDPEDLNAEGILHLCIGQPIDERALAAEERLVIRTPMSLDKKTGALFFPGGGIREGQRVRMTRRDPQEIVNSAQDCATALKGAPRDPVLVLQFDCAGRGRAVFGADASTNIVRPAQEALGTSAAWLGFHTYGEIAPLGDAVHYHNYTVVLCTVYEHV